MNAQPPAVPFLDLKAQQARIAGELRRRLDAVLAHCQFILGPEVAELEAAAGGILRRKALRRGQLRHRRHPDRTDGGGHRPRRRGVPAGLHLHRDRRGAAGAGRHAGVRGCRSAYLPDRPGASAPTHRRRARGRQAAAACADRRGPVRPAGGLAGAECHCCATKDCSRWTTWRRASAPRCTGSIWAASADATATSFFPSKPLGAYGDGGALFTEDAERAALFRSLRTHGEGTTRYEVLRTGMNGRLDSMQAAVLLAKLTVFAEELRARERVAPILRFPARQRRAGSRPRAGQHQRLGDLCHPAVRRRDARPRAAEPEGRRRADRDLLPASAASPAGLPRPARRCGAAGFGGPGDSASWRCRSIRT